MDDRVRMRFKNFEAHDFFEQEMWDIINHNFKPESLDEAKLATLQACQEWQVDDLKIVEDVGDPFQDGCERNVEDNPENADKRVEECRQEEYVLDDSPQLVSNGFSPHNAEEQCDGGIDSYFTGCRIEMQDGVTCNSLRPFRVTDLEERQWHSIEEPYTYSKVNEELNPNSSSKQTIEFNVHYDGHHGYCTNQATLPIPAKQFEGSDMDSGGYAPINVPKVEENTGNLNSSLVPTVKDESSVARPSNELRRAENSTSSLRKHSPKTNLAWLIDNCAISLLEELRYLNKKDGAVMAIGKATREGVQCNCCGKVFTLSNFEAHAKSSNHRPAEHIYLLDGRTLSECQIEALKRTPREVAGLQPHKRRKKIQNHSQKDDVICSICSDGGDLILCDSCPSAYHPACIGLKGVPKGSWLCRPCQCVICEKAVCSAPTEAILQCNQCECRYHVKCWRESGLTYGRNNLHVNWFCSEQCSKIYAYLLNCLGKPNPTNIEGVSWTIWRHTREDDRVKLNLAIDLLHECFLPMIDKFTGRDIIQDVVFNQISNLKRLSFRSFYTVILEKGDELISVATIRDASNLH